MIKFISGCIALAIDFAKAVGQEIYHERSCAMKTDDVPHRCTCKRNGNRKIIPQVKDWICRDCRRGNHHTCKGTVGPDTCVCDC